MINGTKISDEMNKGHNMKRIRDEYKSTINEC